MMKKWQGRVAAVLSVVMLFSCVSAAMTGCRKSETEESKKKTKKTKETTEDTEPTDIEPTDTEPSDTEPSDTSDTGTPPAQFEFTSANYPVIDGSTSTKPMATAMTSIMLGVPRKEAADMLEFHKTTQSFSFLIDGYADILICAQPADSVFEMMDEQDFEYEMEPFAAEALVFVVNTSNPVESLTIEQIQKIYTGEITNWKEVGGEDKEIVAVQRNEEAGSQVMMEKLVMGDLEMMEAPKDLMPSDMEGLIEVVKSYDNSAGAIGYTPYYYATKMKMADGLKILKVEDVMPAQDTIAQGTYPFCTSYYVVIPKDIPADSPARIMFDWVLGPQGQELAEKEGYVAASKDPDAHGNTEVTINWACYEPAEIPDPIFTRLQDDPIEDFITGSDYGRVFPFAGALKQDYGYEYAGIYGFIDENGRIVCDPVYDSCMLYGAGFYVVEQNECVPGDGDEINYQTKYGVVSTDGQYYSGMIYTDVFYGEDQKYYMVAEEDDTVKVTLMNMDTGRPETEKTYKVDRSGESEFAYANLLVVIDDRYLMYYSSWDAAVEEAYIYDGTTGDLVDELSDLNIIGTAGNMFYSYDTGNRYDDGCVFYNANGERVLEKSYDWYDAFDIDHILMGHDDNSGCDMVDRNGKIKASIDNKNGDIDHFGHNGEHCVAFGYDSVTVYNKNLEVVMTRDLHNSYEYDLMYGEDFYYTEFEFDVQPIIHREKNGTTELFNLETGKYGAFDKEYYGELYPDAVLLEIFGYNCDPEWILADVEDFHIKAQGTGYASVCQDEKSGEFYIKAWEDGHEEQMTVISMKTGEVVWQDRPNPRSDGLTVTYIYDGKIVYETFNGSLTQYAPTYTTSTMMLDQDGNVIFLYNSVMIPDD